MGRLFWKVFLTLFLAQITTVAVVSLLIWYTFPHHGEPPPPPPPMADLAARPDRPPPPPPGPIPPARFPLVPLGVGFLASLLFAALLAHHLSKPILGLRRAFGEVRRGNFDVSLTPEMAGRHDELADLGRDFDSTALQLKQLVASQRRLLHDVSHEVRSPLARMQIAIDLAKQQPEHFQTSVERIERESARINLLMEELLTLARLEAGAYDALNKEEVDLNELLAEIVADARFEATAKGCDVVLEIETDAHIQGHAELLFRALENIVRNATRHTFDSTTVRVILADAEDGIHIRVQDDGPGVPDAALEAMFEPFVRFEARNGNDGYGLGLAIAREVIGKHGGRIRAANRDQGGLDVEIILPDPAAEAAAKATAA